MRPDSSRLIEAVNGALLEMRRDGTFDELQATWF
jgi:ABC-type amino acid transport substrate-binding protein